MAFSNPAHHSDGYEKFMDYIKKYPQAIERNTMLKQDEFCYTPLRTWTRIAVWCKTQNITVEQLANSLEKQE
jgi:hypothetical protein